MSRFAKGKSGNPRGRPRKPVVHHSSDFEELLAMTVTAQQDGVVKTVSVEETLQLKLYEAAINGNKSARRRVLDMVWERELWFSKRPVAEQRPFEMRIASAVHNADQALFILDIMKPVVPQSLHMPDVQYQIEPWAAQAAIKRMRPRRMSQKDIDACRKATRNGNQIQWPEQA